MSDVTELRCWPSCVDALDWSQDGIIALASDERVELLFPNTVSYDRDQEVAQWQHVSLAVPWFSNEELPTKQPATLENYSIGEEISSSAPIAVAWSPPGLAKHRRCALATLTANLVLSIWSADGTQQESSSWGRRLIINDALTEYFVNHFSGTLVPASFEEELERLRTRIRAFTWAPALPNAHTSSTLGTRTSYGPHMVAVCNDNNQLMLVSIESSTTTFGMEKRWTAKVLTHMSLTLDSETVSSLPLTFEDRMSQQRQLSHVSWSPWIKTDDGYISVIVYATNVDVRARVVTSTNSLLRLGDEVVYPGINIRYSGLMKWCPIIDGNALSLALFANTGLVYLTISARDASIIDQAVHDLDGRWDQVSGAVWEANQRSVPRLHFSSILSTIQNATTILDASRGMLTATGSSSWRDQLENSTSLFSAKHDLKGNVKMKVWGLAISPLGDFIATCHTVHPSDMIEYGSPADRRGTVAVTALSQHRELGRYFPERDVSAEGVLFSLRKLADNTIEDGTQTQAFVGEMTGKLIEAYSFHPIPSNEHGSSASSHTGLELHEIIQRVKHATFFDAQALEDRYTVLTLHACSNNHGADDLQRTLIAYRLATASQALPTALFHTSTFSREVRMHHQGAIALVQKLIEPAHELAEEATDSAQVPLEAGLSEADPNEATLRLKQTESSSVDLCAAEVIIDTCDFCSGPIPFTHLRIASCTNGHEFPRCGLSLIAIQAPGITKYCGICTTPYLNEEFVAAQELQDGHHDAQHGQNTAPSTTSHVATQQQQQQEEEERVTSFAKILFYSCDACIYCGGKFVG
ncbi:hypothetical protein ACEQ8H_003636 [Pleosporales sp. CAS-2024a]